MKTVRIIQIMDPVVHMPQCLPFYVKRIRPPHTCPDKNRLIAVPEQIVNGNSPSHRSVWPYLNILQPQMAILEII